MRANDVAIIPIGALTLAGCILVVLGLFAAGSIELVALGLGSLVVAAVLGTVLAVVDGRRS